MKQQISSSLCTAALAIAALLFATLAVRVDAAAIENGVEYAGFQKLEYTFKGASHRLFISNETATWFDAQMKCVELGFGLVSAKTAEAQEALVFALEYFHIVKGPWISLHRSTTSSPWKWGDGTLVTYTNWFSESEANGIGGAVVAGATAAAGAGAWFDVDIPNYQTIFLCN